jgi:predicted SAM-dependent methyltransferase
MSENLRNFIEHNLSQFAPIARAMLLPIRCELSKLRIRRLVQSRKDICIDVGAGEKRGENGWTTIDLNRNCDIYWDLRNGLPFPDATVSKIYTSHFLEHLTFAESKQFLGECLRVLRKGGSVSICVPNARIYIEAYASPGSVDMSGFLLYKPAYHRGGKIDYINYIAYMDGHHKHMFDEENLVSVLVECGFLNACLRSFDSELDLAERRHESIYAEATKLECVES